MNHRVNFDQDQRVGRNRACDALNGEPQSLSTYKALTDQIRFTLIRNGLRRDVNEQALASQGDGAFGSNSRIGVLIAQVLSQHPW